MTCQHWNGKVGYKGQKYSVVGDDSNGKVVRLGWTNGKTVNPWRFLGKHLDLKNLRLEEVKGS